MLIPCLISKFLLGAVEKSFSFFDGLRSIRLKPSPSLTLIGKKKVLHTSLSPSFFLLHGRHMVLSHDLSILIPQIHSKWWLPAYIQIIVVTIGVFSEWVFQSQVRFSFLLHFYRQTCYPSPLNGLKPPLKKEFFVDGPLAGYFLLLKSVY